MRVWDLVSTVVTWIGGFFVVHLLACFVAYYLGRFRRYRESKNPNLAARRLAREKERERALLQRAHQNRVVGDLYAVISKADQSLEFWLTEDPDGWDIRSKFGWFQHKRARPIPSKSHSVVLLRELVVLDPKLHKHLPPFSPSTEARKLRAARFDAEVQTDLSGDLYVVHDRLQCRITPFFVAQGLGEQFHTEHPSSEFLHVHLAARRIFLRHIDRVKGIHEFFSTGGSAPN